MSSGRRPRIGIAMGDVAGIGPEIIAKVLTDPRMSQHLQPLVIGDGRVMGATEEMLGLSLPIAYTSDVAQPFTAEAPISFLDLGNISPQSFRMGESDAAVGSAAISFLSQGLALALRGEIEALVFAPLNKAALHLAGLDYKDELDVFAKLLPGRRARTIMKLGDVFRATVVGHYPFREIYQRLTTEAILETIISLDEGVRAWGVPSPKLAVAALNPHAGEGGLFGDEEANIIEPAIAAGRVRGIDARGPIPADTVYVRAMKGEFNGVVFLYHDQGNIAMKAAGFGRAVVIYHGLPFPCTSTGHGTAYDIAGKGLADHTNMKEALEVARRMASFASSG